MTLKKVLSACSLLLLLAACDSSNQPQSQAPQRPIPRVSTVSLTPLSVILYSDMPGRTLAYEQAEVRPEVTGILRERVFQEGAAVKKGDALYLIDPDLYQAAYDSAKANLEKAKAALSVAALREKRTGELRRQNSISQQDYDDTRAASLQAQAEVAAANAAVQSAKINLDRTRIVAPISGLIGTSAVSVGSLVAGNQATPLTTIYQINPMNVDLTQSVQELFALGKQQENLSEEMKSKKLNNLDLPVILIMNDGSQYPIQGKLKFVDVGVNSDTATMTMRAEFPNPDLRLLPGLFVRAKLQIGVNENAILIPQNAVLRDTKGDPYVFVAEGYDSSIKPVDGPDAPKAKAVKRSITLGASYGGNWMVTGGLKAGESVILEGLQNVTEQSDIAIVKRSELNIPENADYLSKNSTFQDFATEIEKAQEKTTPPTSTQTAPTDTQPEKQEDAQ